MTAALLPTEQYTAIVVGGLYVINTQPRAYNRLCTGLTVNGPQGSSLQINLGTIPFDNTPRGDINTADYGSGRPIPKNMALQLVWSVGTGTPIPTCSIYFSKASN